ACRPWLPPCNPQSDRSDEKAASSDPAAHERKTGSAIAEAKIVRAACGSFHREGVGEPRPVPDYLCIYVKCCDPDLDSPSGERASKAQHGNHEPTVAFIRSLLIALVQWRLCASARAIHLRFNRSPASRVHLTADWQLG